MSLHTRYICINLIECEYNLFVQSDDHPHPGRSGGGELLGSFAEFDMDGFAVMVGLMVVVGPVTFTEGPELVFVLLFVMLIAFLLAADTIIRSSKTVIYGSNPTCCR